MWPAISLCVCLACLARRRAAAGIALKTTEGGIPLVQDEVSGTGNACGIAAVRRTTGGISFGATTSQCEMTFALT